MMGLTADGQVDPELVRRRDRRLGFSTADVRRDRADIPVPSPLPGANSWETGHTVQTRLEQVDVTR